MNTSLARRVRAAANKLRGGPISDSRYWLRCLMRFCLVWRHLSAVIALGHKNREEMTADEWRAFVAESVEYFNAHLRAYDEQEMLRYIGIRRDELPEYAEAFSLLPDSKNYE